MATFETSVGTVHLQVCEFCNIRQFFRADFACVTSHVHDDLVQDWLLKSAASAGVADDVKNCEDTGHAGQSQSVLQVVQLTANSITVSWKIPATLKYMKPSQREAALKSGFLSAGLSMTRLLSHLGSQEALLNPALDMSLLITAASNMGLESPVLILPSVNATGSFRIEGLDSGSPNYAVACLYRDLLVILRYHI